MHIAITLIIFSLFVLTGCKNIQDIDAVVVLSSDKSAGEKSGKHAPAHGRRAKHGPPPHAPAHGYRHKQESGVKLTFDSGLGVYVVVDMSDVFFHNGVYIRLEDDHWQVSVSLGDDWHEAKHDEVPVKLKKAKGSKHKGKGRSKGNGQR